MTIPLRYGYGYGCVCVCVCVAEGNWQTKHANNLFSHLFITCITHASIHLFTILYIIYLFCFVAAECLTNLHFVLRFCNLHKSIENCCRAGGWTSENGRAWYIFLIMFTAFLVYLIYANCLFRKVPQLPCFLLSLTARGFWLIVCGCLQSFSLLLPHSVSLFALFLFTAKNCLTKKRTVF